MPRRDLLGQELKRVGLGPGALLIEKRIEDAGAGLESVGDAERGGFRLGGFGAGEICVDRLAEEFYPALELLFFKGQNGVFGPRLAFVIASAEKHFGPEGIHGGEVMVPIDFSDFVEDGPEDVIAVDAIVEGIDERLDVLLCADVVQQRESKARRTMQQTAVDD